MSLNFNTTATSYDPTNALALGNVAKLAYEPDSAKVKQTTGNWGFPQLRQFQSSKQQFPAVDTEGFVIANTQDVIVAFRGTEVKVIRDWLTDLRFKPTAWAGNAGKIHSGFNDALESVYDEMRNAVVSLRDNGQNLWFTGHSLGAALATLAAWRLRDETNDVHYPQGIYTFGQPRTGNEDFVAAFDGRLKSRMFRFDNNNDIVPHVPLKGEIFDFDHVGNLCYFDTDGDLKTRRPFFDHIEGLIRGIGQPGLDAFEDHEMDKYLAALNKNLGITLTF
ncbi:MAG: lipase family protein [Blastocatellia bacterium]